MFLHGILQTIIVTDRQVSIDLRLISDWIDTQLMIMMTMMREKANKLRVFNYEFIIAKLDGHNE